MACCTCSPIICRIYELFLGLGLERLKVPFFFSYVTISTVLQLRPARRLSTGPSGELILGTLFHAIGVSVCASRARLQPNSNTRSLAAYTVAETERKTAVVGPSISASSKLQELAGHGPWCTRFT